MKFEKTISFALGIAVTTAFFQFDTTEPDTPLTTEYSLFKPLPAN